MDRLNNDFIFYPTHPMVLWSEPAPPPAWEPILAWSPPLPAGPYVESRIMGFERRFYGAASWLIAECDAAGLVKEGDYVLHYNPEGFNV